MEDVVSLTWEIYLSLLGWSVEEGKKEGRKERDRWYEIKRNWKGRSKIDWERKEEKKDWVRKAAGEKAGLRTNGVGEAEGLMPRQWQNALVSIRSRRAGHHTAVRRARPCPTLKSLFRGRRKRGIQGAVRWCLRGPLTGSHGVRESASSLRQQLLPRKLFNQKYCILSGVNEARLK